MKLVQIKWWHWVLGVLGIFIILLGGPRAWISAGFGLGVFSLIMGFRVENRKWVRIGLIVAGFLLTIPVLIYLFWGVSQS